MEICPFPLIDVPDCLIDGSSPQYAVNSLMLLNLLISFSSAIIREVVNHFGGEQLSKIIISDVPSRIKKVMK